MTFSAVASTGLYNSNIPAASETENVVLSSLRRASPWQPLLWPCASSTLWAWIHFNSSHVLNLSWQGCVWILKLPRPVLTNARSLDVGRRIFLQVWLCSFHNPSSWNKKRRCACIINADSNSTVDHKMIAWWIKCCNTAYCRMGGAKA